MSPLLTVFIVWVGVWLLLRSALELAMRRADPLAWHEPKSVRVLRNLVCLFSEPAHAFKRAFYHLWHAVREAFR